MKTSVRHFLLITAFLICNVKVYSLDNPLKQHYMEQETTEKVQNTSQQPGMCEKLPMQSDGIVRLSKVELYPEYAEEYMKFAIEVGEISLRTEPGVLTMYAVREKDNPCMVTILETYSSQKAYQQHIASKHFQKYKQGTLHMVKKLTLTDQIPLDPANKIDNYIQ